MKRYFLIGLLVSIVPNICFGYSARYTQLVREKERKMAELEKCTGSTKGLKIAGISTLGLTAVGVAGNVIEAKKIKDYDKDIKSAQQSIAQKERELSEKEAEIADIKAKTAYKNNCISTGGKMLQNGTCDCGSNMQLNSDGSCVLKINTDFEFEYETEEESDPTPEMIAYDQQKEACNGTFKEGKCECADGYTPDENGKCVYNFGATQTTKDKTCPDGYTPDENGNCVFNFGAAQNGTNAQNPEKEPTLEGRRDIVRCKVDVKQKFSGNIPDEYKSFYDNLLNSLKNQRADQSGTVQPMVKGQPVVCIQGQMLSQCTNANAGLAALSKAYTEQYAINQECGTNDPTEPNISIESTYNKDNADDTCPLGKVQYNGKCLNKCPKGYKEYNGICQTEEIANANLDFDKEFDKCRKGGAAGYSIQKGCLCPNEQTQEWDGTKCVDKTVAKDNTTGNKTAIDLKDIKGTWDADWEGKRKALENTNMILGGKAIPGLNSNKKSNKSGIPSKPVPTQTNTNAAAQLSDSDVISSDFYKTKEQCENAIERHFQDGIGGECFYNSDNQKWVLAYTIHNGDPCSCTSNREHKNAETCKYIQFGSVNVNVARSFVDFICVVDTCKNGYHEHGQVCVEDQI